jgi:hypothetical protein
MRRARGRRRGPGRTCARACACAIALAGVLSSAAARADQEPTVEWSPDWPRFRVVELANTVALTVGSIVIHQTPVTTHGAWTGPILFDKPARALFRSKNPKTQEFAGNLSDALYHGMVLAPYVVDNYIVALGVHQNADVALQMTLIDMQSLGLSGVISLAAEHAVGRQRPFVRDCRPVPGAPDDVGFNHCDGVGDYQSFYSGHAAAAFTMAGLTCIHHQHLPLYGGGLPDALACITMMSLATTTGVLRLMVDRHWASDVLVGVGVGLLDGYVLPAWLHYGFGGRGAKSATILHTSFGYLAPIPQVYDGGAGLGLGGIF